MIALFALIAVIVVVGGGIEVLRRARFGVGPSAAHHRALDTLGHITNQNADATTDLVAPEEPTVLSHVRRAVESDPAQPRIEPQPVSRPVAVPAITGGPNFVGTIPAGHPLGRGPDTEIEGVRLLIPEADDVEEPGGPEGAVEGDEDWDDGWPDDEAWDDDDRVAHEAVDAWEGAADDDDGQEVAGPPDPWTVPEPAAEHPDPEVAGATAPWDARPDEDSWEGVAGWEAILHEAGADPGLAWGVEVPHDAATGGDGAGDPYAELHPDPDEHQPLSPDPEPVTAEHEPVTAEHEPVTEETAVVAPDRIVRIDDLGGGPSWPEDRTAVRAAPAVDAPTSELAVVEPDPRPHLEGEVDDEDDATLDPEAWELGGEVDLRDDETDGHPVVVRFDDLGGAAGDGPDDAPGPDVRPKHIAAGPSGQSGAIPGLTPDETRAQLAALVQSGGMGAAAAGGRQGRRHRRQRSHPHDRRRVVSSAAMILAAVLVLGGAVFLVTNQSSSGTRTRPSASRPEASAPAPTSTTTAPPAALVSQTSSTATYEVTGAPMISLNFSSECWTEARQGSSAGPILFEGTQAAGAQRQLTGPVWIRLGNPTAVSISVGGATISQPSVTAGSPFNLQFQ